MSANVNFTVTAATGTAGGPARAGEGGKPAADAPAAPVIILPYDILNNLQGRRVTVLLSIKKEELEGTLRSVDADRGDLFLEDVVHYAWEATVPAAPTAAAAAAPAAAAAAVTPSDEGSAGGRASAVRPCVVGGGGRRILNRCDAVMVNSRFIDVVTPTLFGEVEVEGGAR